MKFRVGNGYDVHAFAGDRKLILGGVEIGYAKGLVGHSDADVLTHAVMDALLGAVGLGDIGRHFPDTDDAFKDIDSLKLLKQVVDKVASAGWKISNIDVTVIAQKPRLAGYIETMEQKLAGILQIDIGQINIKATTTEKLGFTGREEGIAAIATSAVYQ